MKLGVLFSGGKDSTYACMKAMQKEEVTCLITIVSENPESYMFHTPNIKIAELQAEALGLPIVLQKTKGEKEKELEDLEKAIIIAKEKYGIEGVVTGAIASVYQATRVQKVCDNLGLWCFNPLWQKDQIEHLNDIIRDSFSVVITAVLAQSFGGGWLGKKIDEKAVDELKKLSNASGINPAGEGGEMETFVLDGPIFQKRIKIAEAEKSEGIYHIKKAVLVAK